MLHVAGNDIDSPHADEDSVKKVVLKLMALCLWVVIGWTMYTSHQTEQPLVRFIFGEMGINIFNKPKLSFTKIKVWVLRAVFSRIYYFFIKTQKIILIYHWKFQNLGSTNLNSWSDNKMNQVQTHCQKTWYINLKWLRYNKMKYSWWTSKNYIQVGLLQTPTVGLGHVLSDGCNVGLGNNKAF